jgi:hypothetical protein
MGPPPRTGSSPNRSQEVLGCQAAPCGASHFHIGGCRAAEDVNTRSPAQHRSCEFFLPKILTCLICSFLKVEAVLARQSQLDKAAKVFSTITKELINETMSQGGSSYLDIVGKVINFIPVRWLSNHIVRCLVSCVRITFVHPSHLDRAPSED